MPSNKILTIVNISHESGEARTVVIEGNKGFPSVRVGKLARVSIDFYDAQLDDKFADTLSLYVQRNWVKVFLDNVELSLEEVGNIKYAIPSSDPPTPVVNASDVVVSSSGFSGILSPADVNVQLALNTIDSHTHGGASSIIEERGLLTTEGGIIYTPVSGGIAIVVRDP
jgi:hypothetical protein